MADQGTTRGAWAPGEASTAPAATVFGHAPFHGTFHTRIEPNGRVALPAALKGAFAGRGLLRAHRDQYLMLWTLGGFEAVVAEFEGTQPGGVVHPRTRKRMFMSVTEVAVDRQHRFVVPPELKATVGLGERVVLAGSIETIEIWPEEDFAAEEASFDDADLFFDGFSGLSTETS